MLSSTIRAYKISEGEVLIRETLSKSLVVDQMDQDELIELAQRLQRILNFLHIYRDYRYPDMSREALKARITRIHTRLTTLFP